MGTLSAELKGYPSPYKPFGPNAGTGLGQTGTVAAGVTFEDLPQGGEIKIFNSQSEEVGSIIIPDDLTFPYRLSWDLKNSLGQLVPDDIYYAVVTSGPNSKTLYLLKGIGEPGDTFVRSIPALSPGTITTYTYDAVGTKTGSVIIEIKGTASEKVSVIGGAKGFVNPGKGEKLSIYVKTTAAGNIKTSIFDGKGRLVREYNMSTDGAQATVVQWDGKDSAGRNVPSGIYLIHVVGPGVNITKRTVIIK